MTEQNYFFKLSVFGDRLLDFYEKNPNWILTPYMKISASNIRNMTKAGV